MATETSPNENPSSAAPTPAVASCRRKKNESATFLEDVKDHIDEFIHASMDEHKTCFQKTINKVCYRLLQQCKAKEICDFLLFIVIDDR